MLSKEEIKNSFIRIETICKKEVCLFNQPIIEENLNQIKRYIIQLESDKQKLIEKLEKLKQDIENSIPRQVVKEKVKEVIELIESEQFKIIMGDTTKCNRIKYILKEELLKGK